MKLHLNLLAGALFGVVALAPINVRAQDGAPPPTTEGTVIAIDSGDLVIDLGNARGAREGQTVELWRPLRLKHPVTGKILSDRFRIGTVRLTQVQTTLSLAKADGSFLRPPAAGDHVLLATRAERPPAIVNERASPDTAPAPKTEPPAAPPREPVDPDVQAVASLFEDLRGTPPETRAHAYESFARARPKSRFAAVLHEEATLLLARATDSAREEPEFLVRATRLSRVRPGTLQRFALELDERFVGAVLHVRAKGATAYRSLPMASVGPRYWSVMLPGDVLVPPALEYFVEGVPKSGAQVAIVGSEGAPKESAVDPVPFTGKPNGTLAFVGITSELASFNTRKANDYLFQTEGTFGWRMRDVGVRAVRSGFGVLRGKGGSLVDLDTLGKRPSDVGLTYGYIEAEVAPVPDFALIGRPIIGLRDGGATGGAQAFLRIGSDLKTNLLVGGEVLGTVGLRGIVQLDWRTIRRVPITLRSEVTNQPAGFGTDVGARAIAQVGYELTPELTVSARGSYQGRTINHAGPGAGLGVSYQW